MAEDDPFGALKRKKGEGGAKTVMIPREEVINTKMHIMCHSQNR